MYQRLEVIKNTKENVAKPFKTLAQSVIISGHDSKRTRNRNKTQK